MGAKSDEERRLPAVAIDIHVYQLGEEDRVYVAEPNEGAERQ